MLGGWGLGLLAAAIACGIALLKLAPRGASAKQP